MIGPKVLTWVGGEHPFALYLGQLRALQEAVDAGPEELLIRLRVGKWRVDDLAHTLRLGLIGGGMGEVDAGRLVASLFDLHPVMAFKSTVLDVLIEALIGPEDDQPGKSEGAAPSARESGDSAGSIAPDAASD